MVDGRLLTFRFFAEPISAKLCIFSCMQFCTVADGCIEPIRWRRRRGRLKATKGRNCSRPVMKSRTPSESGFSFPSNDPRELVLDHFFLSLPQDRKEASFVFTHKFEIWNPSEEKQIVDRILILCARVYILRRLPINLEFFFIFDQNMKTFFLGYVAVLVKIILKIKCINKCIKYKISICISIP